ncbi:MAG: tripartite tricarboxylate transporter TctB family protein [Pseudomonadota bacterium]
MTTSTPPTPKRQWTQSEGAKDLVTAIGLFLFALGGFVFINLDGAAAYAGPGGVTWRTMPFIYSGALAFLSVLYMGQSILRIRRELALPPQSVNAEEAAERALVLFRRVATLVLLVIYASLLKLIGFAILTPIFLFSLFRLYKNGTVLNDAGLSLVGGFALWVLFVRVLQLNLKGTWFDPVTPFLFSAFKAVGL